MLKIKKSLWVDPASVNLYLSSVDKRFCVSKSIEGKVIEFTGYNTLIGHMVGVWVDSSSDSNILTNIDTVNRFLYVPIDNQQLFNNYTKGYKTLLEIINMGLTTNYLVDLDDEYPLAANIVDCYKVKLKDIPDQYLPTEKSFYALANIDEDLLSMDRLALMHIVMRLRKRGV